MKTFKMEKMNARKEVKSIAGLMIVLGLLLTPFFGILALSFTLIGLFILLANHFAS